mmetsp:Transcript_15250/g.31439  ORF Transcript_15250/g.31439 Transcript_15250/m.31439 type:complete len:331 (-) Transcript_15250:1465-2457(-)
MSGATIFHTFCCDLDLSTASSSPGCITPYPSSSRCSPTWAPSGGSSSSTCECSSLLPHRTMPDDRIPRILTGLRLHSTVTIRPCMSSSGMKLARPEITCRGSSSPTSICSRYSESASGCFSQDRILPTRMSSRVTGSTLPLRSSTLVGPAFFLGLAAPLPPLCCSSPSAAASTSRCCAGASFATVSKMRCGTASSGTDAAPPFPPRALLLSRSCRSSTNLPNASILAAIGTTPLAPAASASASDATCAPMSGPARLPVMASRAGKKRRLPLRPVALPMADTQSLNVASASGPVGMSPLAWLSTMALASAAKSSPRICGAASSCSAVAVSW